MPASASGSALDFSWSELSKHVTCSIAVFTALYIALHRACKRHFSRSHRLCQDELNAHKKTQTDEKSPRAKGPSMSSKLATRVISTVNAIVCCAGGIVIMYDMLHNDNSDYSSGCGNGIDHYLCWLGGCVIGYLVADWLCEGVEDVTMALHHVVGAVMLFTGCQPYTAGVVSHVYLMELSTLPLNVSWYKRLFTVGKYESSATAADKSLFETWNKVFQVSFILVRCVWCPLNFYRALQAFHRCHSNQSLANLPASLPVVSLFLVVVVQFVWLYKIAVVPMLKPKGKKSSSSAPSSKPSKS